MLRSTLVTLFFFAATGSVVHAQTGGPAAVAPEDPETVAPLAPAAPASLEVWEAANRARGVKLLVSIEQRRLWMMDGGIVLFTAPVAVGRSVVLEYEGNVWNFATPKGRRVVRSKEKDPVWIPPDWHYVELALMQGWKLESMNANRRVRLSDGSSVAVRGRRLGRILPDGSFVPVPLGEEAVFDGTLFIPPIGSENRRVSGPLGRYKLDLGGAYYLHGTEEQGSIGTAATHGCIRLRDDDIEYLYRTVAVGTPVFLF